MFVFWIYECIFLCNVQLGLDLSTIICLHLVMHLSATEAIFTLLFICLFVGFGVVYLGSSSRHGLWYVVSCGGGGAGMDGGERGFFISSRLCSGIWMSASSKCHSCQALIIINGCHLSHRSRLHLLLLNKELDLLCMSALHLRHCFLYRPSFIKSMVAICKTLLNLQTIS